MRSTIAVAPATCANLGPGFDSFGVAVGRYETEVEVFPNPTYGVQVVNEGSFAAEFPQDESNTASQVVIGITGSSAWQIRVRSNIPHGSGLGSSAALIYCGCRCSMGVANAGGN